MTTKVKPLYVLFAIASFATFVRAADQPVDFARQVLPVLSNKCFVCHGPDTRKKDLVRLDSYAAATRDLDGYKAIDPAALEESEIIERIHSKDDPMPPKKSENKLTAAERDILTRWVKQGGKYATHWAFVPPKKIQPPAKASNPIDGFVLAQLQKNKTDFAPEADRATLARRAALVLIGLPPESQQLSAFLADKKPGAYERLIDDLMKSPRYGEHQARYWLDAVRYGDTHGLHLDNRRGIFPYRDWVIQALNDNQPFDEFITWQLAGDLLPNPTMAQRVATGYVRMNPSTAEGGAIPAEFQAKNNFDRTENLGTVFLGMTLTCARCHTHKYDPIPQSEYYRLFAFFNSTSEPSMDGNKYIYGPIMRVPPNVMAWTEWQQLSAERDAMLSTIKVDQSVVVFAKALNSLKTTNWRMSIPVAKGAASPPGSDRKAWSNVKGLPGALKNNLPKQDNKAVWISCNIEAAQDLTISMRFNGGAGSELKVNGKVADPTSVALSKGANKLMLKLVGKGRTRIELHFDNPWQSLARAGKWESCNEADRMKMLAQPTGPLAGLKLHKKAAELSKRLDAITKSFTTTLVAQDLSKPRDTRLLERGEYDRPIGDPVQPGTPTIMGALPEGAPRNRLGLARWLTARENPLVARVLINRVWQRTFGYGLVRTPEDFGLQGEQPTHPELLDWLAVELHDRKWNLKHMLRLMVTSKTFKQNSSWRKDVSDPENRLFARGPRHRLDAEVVRDIALWASGLLNPVMGGEGIKPYQPAGMWKALMHPASNTKNYVKDKGERLYRRSLYVYWKRTSPHPMMTLFDAPNRESSCVQRSRSNTPLQSLALLNEIQRIEMSRKLAERLLRDAGDDAKRIDMLFNMLASRKPSASERTVCMKLLATMRTRYAANEKDAIALLSTGDAPRDQKLNAAEHAAWTQVAVTVLASDLTLLLY